MPTIVAAVTDLLFQSRLRERALALGYEVVIADADDSLRAALAAGPCLLVVDLHVASVDWRQAVAAAEERRVPVLAFGRHTDAELLRAARAAGCDRVVPRSTFVEKLPELLREATVD